MNEGKSVNWVIAASMIVIALFGWGYMAGVYATDVEEFRPDVPQGTDYRGRRRISAIGAAVSGIYHFVKNGMQQIPNAPAVISYNFSHKLWLPITIGIFELAAIGGGFGMKRLEQNLNAPPRHRRSF